jgi:hypothetical protein
MSDLCGIDVDVDKEKLVIALRSVINNAIEVSPKGRADSHITLTVKKVYSSGTNDPQFMDNKGLVGVRFEVYHNRINEETYRVSPMSS